MNDRFLPGVPGSLVEEMFNNAPGNEIATGKFDSPESSAALVANAFGYFLNRPEKLPALPGCQYLEWPAHSLELERTVRFPWRGGRHPVLDVLIETPSALIGVESKRFEPFRTNISEAYRRPVWGNQMKGYEQVRDCLDTHIDAAQLFKHALALRTQVNRKGAHSGLTPILFYLYAEPETWPRDSKPIGEDAKARHRQEIEDFARTVEGDEVKFVSCSYRELLTAWQEIGTPKVRAHAKAVIERFAP